MPTTSAFTGRLDDIGHEGMDMVASIIEIYDQYNWTSRLVAGRPTPDACLRGGADGADVATIPFNVLAKLAHR